METDKEIVTVRNRHGDRFSRRKSSRKKCIYIISRYNYRGEVGRKHSTIIRW